MNARVAKRFAWVIEELLETGRVELPPYPGGLYLKKIEPDLQGAIDVKPGRMFEVVKGGRPFKIECETAKHLVIKLSSHKSYKNLFGGKDK